MFLDGGGTVVDRRKLIAAIACNAAVVVLEIWGIIVTISYNGVGGAFIYYTNCANVLAAVACAVCLVGEVRALRGGRGPGRGAAWLKFAGACCLLMTFFVVVFVLVPMLNNAGYDGARLMFTDKARLVTHLIAPLLVVPSYVIFEADRTMTVRQSLVGFYPTLAYAMLAYVCNIARVWDGPYPFFQVYNMELWETLIWFVVLFVLAFGLCQIPRFLSRFVRIRSLSDTSPRS